MWADLRTRSTKVSIEQGLPVIVQHVAITYFGVNPMPLTLEAAESDFGWSSVIDVVVVDGFSREFGATGSFGDARVGAVASGRVGALEDLGDGVSSAGGDSFRGKNPPAR